MPRAATISALEVIGFASPKFLSIAQAINSHPAITSARAIAACLPWAVSFRAFNVLTSAKGMPHAGHPQADALEQPLLAGQGHSSSSTPQLRRAGKFPEVRLEYRRLVEVQGLADEHELFPCVF